MILDNHTEACSGSDCDRERCADLPENREELAQLLAEYDSLEVEREKIRYQSDLIHEAGEPRREWPGDGEPPTVDEVWLSDMDEKRADHNESSAMLLDRLVALLRQA